MLDAGSHHWDEGRPCWEHSGHMQGALPWVGSPGSKEMSAQACSLANSLVKGVKVFCLKNLCGAAEGGVGSTC